MGGGIGDALSALMDSSISWLLSPAAALYALRILMDTFSDIYSDYSYADDQYARPKEYHKAIQANAAIFEDLAYEYMDALEAYLIVAVQRVQHIHDLIVHIHVDVILHPVYQFRVQGLFRLAWGGRCWSYYHYIVSFWLRQYRFVNRHCATPMCAGEFYVPAAL